ncbi:peptide-methionine (S)-S-oxide reductase MsrA [Halosimplex salinum]|uniref:peptide-methionine (S)-S-oxide reductase MsrA n=1 Tax=Halosimplex salinum TaxID=1710538 RepID=UPI000F4A3812|nr:peptide-methionine (S)-S-oxide reductase [Halosimplex salinum]
MTDPDRIVAYDERAPSPAETETATFALGCFWGPDATFGAREGVVRTRVGYAGGEKADPTYHDLGGHSEAVQVDFDPETVSFEELVDLAIANHDPRNQPEKRQYQRVLFFEAAEQREAIDERLGRLDLDRVETRVEPLAGFHAAEPYHQKFNLRSKRAIQSAFEDAGYDDEAVRESPAAAKLNAHVTGKSVPGVEAVL